MTLLTVEGPGPTDVISPGTSVEVRRRFDRAWARGFVVVGVDTDGYRLRRSSDGALLPVSFPVGDVRPAGRRY